MTKTNSAPSTPGPSLTKSASSASEPQPLTSAQEQSSAPPIGLAERTINAIQNLLPGDQQYLIEEVDISILPILEAAFEEARADLRVDHCTHWDSPAGPRWMGLHPGGSQEIFVGPLPPVGSTIEARGKKIYIGSHA